MSVWWQNRNINSYNNIINQINLSMHEGDNIRKCTFLFDALNQIWNDYFRYLKLTDNSVDEDWSDNRKFFELIKSLESNKILLLCKSQGLKDFSLFEPKIMNHDTLRKEEYDLSNIPLKLIKKSQNEHKQLYNAYDRLVENNYDENFVEPLIKKLTQLLYIVRSNIAHGEKTPKGPDINKVKRDADVCRLTLPLLCLLLELLFDSPSKQIACYGTLLPGQPNSEILEKYNGSWYDGIVRGEIKHSNGLPYFKWKTTGDDIPVKIFESLAVSENISDLDRFEGKEYRRIWIPVKIENYFIICSIYEERGNF